MPIKLLEEILNKINKNWIIDKNCEITLEANPTSSEAKKFKEFKTAGVNRLSIGIQALNDKDLLFLGRKHNSLEAINVIKTAGKIFDNFSFDLIYARPKQTLKKWENELKEAIKLANKHLSLYQLTIEKGTVFYKEYKDNKFSIPDEDIAANLYNLTNSIMQENNFYLYEISNYSKINYECQHNLTYWNNKEYIGVGAGSHSRVCFDNENYRRSLMMFHKPDNWLKNVNNKQVGIQTNEIIAKSSFLEEIILMGLRLTKGIDNSIFKQYFNLNIDKIFDYNKLQILIEKEFIDITQDNIRITDKGRILTNSIILKIISSINKNNIIYE